MAPKYAKESDRQVGVTKTRMDNREKRPIYRSPRKRLSDGVVQILDEKSGNFVRVIRGMHFGIREELLAPLAEFRQLQHSILDDKVFGRS